MKPTKVLLLVFLLGVLPLAVYGIYAQILAARELQPAIEKALITPYTAALIQGRYEEAYRNLTSPSFQSTYSLEDFSKAQAETRERLGELMEIRTHRGFSAAGNLFSGRSYYQGGLIYRYTKGEVLVVWEVARYDQSFRIDAMFQDLEETLVPGIH